MRACEAREFANNHVAYLFYVGVIVIICIYAKSYSYGSTVSLHCLQQSISVVSQENIMPTKNKHRNNET